MQRRGENVEKGYKVVATNFRVSTRACLTRYLLITASSEAQRVQVQALCASNLGASISVTAYPEIMWSSVTAAGVENGPAPPSRSKHSATLMAGHVYLLGGRNGNLPLKDLWRYSLGEFHSHCSLIDGSQRVKTGFFIASLFSQAQQNSFIYKFLSFVYMYSIYFS